MAMELSYNDIFLKPTKCIVNSRKECDTSVTLGNYKFDMPVYAANMKSVVDEDTCKFFASRNWFYTMHRFDVDIPSFVKEMIKSNYYTSISIGINGSSHDILQQIYKIVHNVDFITIDVANAWSEKAHDMVSHIRELFPDTFIIIGNVATKEAVIDISSWSIDAIKVGIAGGSVCITKNKTGVARPMASCVGECSKVSNVPIIADGGIVEHGDIAKALACGASMVMAGQLFAGYDQSSGEIIEIEDRMYKEYYGSASKYNKNEYKNVEGKKVLVQYKGDMSKLLVELKEDLQSSISYIGGNKLEDLKSAELFVIKDLYGN